MSILIARQDSCHLMKSLNIQLLKKYSALKLQFALMPPPNHQIITKFKTWKSQFHQLINNEILKFQQKKSLKLQVGQEYLMAYMIQQYKNDQEFNQLMKNVNSTIQTIKDFIRTVSIKDPATEIIVN